MCLICYTRSSLMPEDWFRSSAKRNDDGLGVMWTEEGRVRVSKFMGSTSEQWDHYLSLNLGGIPHAIHHRMGTSGRKNIPMCHPFKILDKNVHGHDLYVMHNGVLSVDQDMKKCSDTWHFVRDWIRPVLKESPLLIRNKSFKRWISKMIGPSNKLLFLDDKGVFTTINKGAGEMRDNFWLSNTYSISTPLPTPYTLTPYNDEWGKRGGYTDYSNFFDDEAPSQKFWKSWRK